MLASKEVFAATEAPADPDAELRAILEALVYVTDEPLSASQIAAALEKPADKIQSLLNELVAEFDKPVHGLTVREVAGGYKMATKPEHHEAIRAFVKKLQPPLKLSLAALETLSVIAYKQPITAPEIMEIRGVQGAGVLKTLLDRKLITTAGRKSVIGKPILYRTTKEFLVQFGLKDLSELPSLKEFEELKRLSLGEEAPAAPEQAAETPSEEAAAQGAAPAGDETVGEETTPEQAADPQSGEAGATGTAERAADPQPGETAAGETTAEHGAAPQPESEEPPSE